MRILHFADLHIGVENYGRVDPDTGLSTRLLDFLQSLDALVDYALENTVDLVLFCGDAYRSRDPSQTNQRELARRLLRLTAGGVPVFLLVGNHDLPHAVSRATAVEIYRTLEVPGVYVGDRLETQRIETRSGPLQVVALPWIRRSAFLAREETHSTSPEGTRGMTLDQVNQAIQERLARLLAEEAERLDPDLPAVLAGHVTISSATTGTEQSMTLVRDHILLPSVVANPAFDYVALGHVHKHQVLHQNPLVVYPGSLQRVDFSEENDTKGFCVVDLDPSKPRGQRLADFRFQESWARPFVTIEAIIQPGDPDPTATVLKAIARKFVDEAVVRLRIQVPAGLEGHIRDEEVRAALQRAHYVAAIYKDVERERRLRLPPEAVEGLTPRQVLQRYLEQSRETPPERRETLLRYAEALIDQELEAMP
ncbi:MAG: exonuclease SbcCD subunit D [Dehalococcoidia bacterium]